MAGGKLSPRQKMINLMYLVFIALIAMTVSKEVISAFGSFDEKFIQINELASTSNDNLITGLKTKAEEKPQEFSAHYQKAEKIQQISSDFSSYIESIKQDIIKGGKYEIDKKTGKLPYEDMDKGTYLDELWFTGDRLTKAGDNVMARISRYKNDIVNTLGADASFERAKENFEKRFNIEDIKPREGNSINYLDYNYKGFPSIASIAKLTAMQNDVKTTEANLFNLFLGNSLEEAVTLKNYTAIVLADKNAFFAGEQFQGKVVLGKYANVPPISLSINGKSQKVETDSLGAARLSFPVGNVGEHEVKGVFTFIENNEELPIDFTGNYVVVPRPKSATISADKMNVVYRGVTNPITVSFAGIPDHKVVANAPGLNKVGNGKYQMRPGTGREVTINVTGTLDDGSKVSDKRTFRIKDIPKPTGTISGQSGSLKLPKSNLSIATVSAKLEDFDFELPIAISSFKIRVPGQPTVLVSGTKMNAQARSAIKRAKRGDVIQVFEIKAYIVGNSKYRLKNVSPVVIEITSN